MNEELEVFVKTFLEREAMTSVPVYTADGDFNCSIAGEGLTWEDLKEGTDGDAG